MNAELRRLGAELRDLRLQPVDWTAIEDQLDRIGTEDDGPADGNTAVQELSQLVFEARVRARFVGQRSRAGLEPTKQTTVLPWVGLICAGLLFAVGALLGGGAILVGIGVLAGFVFIVAFAGSRVAHRGADRAGDGTGALAGEVEDPVPAPPSVRRALDSLDV